MRAELEARTKAVEERENAVEVVEQLVRAAEERERAIGERERQSLILIDEVSKKTAILAINEEN